MAKKSTSRKTKRTVKQKSPKRQARPQHNPSNATATDSLYRPGTLYGTLFSEGSKDYISKDALLKKVSELTGKPIRSVGFAFEVLKSKGHRSNGGRSTVIEEDGKVKLVGLKKPSNN